MRPFHILFLAILILNVTACSVVSTSYYRKTDVVLPPKIQLPEDAKTVALMDRAVPAYYLNSDDVDKSVRRQLLTNVAKSFPQKTTIVQQVDKNNKRNLPSPPISTQRLQAFGQNFDILIALEMFDFVEFRTYRNIKKHQLDENGRDYILDAVEGEKTLELNTFWRIYDTRNNIILEEIPQKVGDGIIAQDLNKTQLNAKLDTLLNINSATFSYQLGKELSRDFLPEYIYSTWQYFRGRHEPLKTAANHIRKGNLENAYHILLRASENTANLKPAEVEAIWYNLAFISTMSGNKSKAMEFAQKAYEIRNSKKVTELMKKIQAE